MTGRVVIFSVRELNHKILRWKRNRVNDLSVHSPDFSVFSKGTLMTPALQVLSDKSMNQKKKAMAV